MRDYKKTIRKLKASNKYFCKLAYQMDIKRNRFGITEETRARFFKIYYKMFIKFCSSKEAVRESKFNLNRMYKDFPRKKPEKRTKMGNSRRGIAPRGENVVKVTFGKD